MGYDKCGTLTKQTNRPTLTKHVELSSPEVNDLPKAGTFPHDDLMKIEGLKRDKSPDKPFLVDSAAPKREEKKEDEKEESNESEKLPSTPRSASIDRASQPRQKKPDKVNRRENARF